ncbi:MAG: TlyA family RNA methyltransferase [Oscillospiraceae bacterium]|nr:TlyA family RNA methyltransferase [Oscillospiraceae bacterium]
MRLDIYLFENGFVKSRETAKRMISEGGVSVNGSIVTKPSKDVSEGDEVKLCAPLPKYVGRGGMKLEKALESFQLSVNGLVCMDIGASTGGFTDCMLQNGAEYVYAVDVGHGQLDEKLICSPRVRNMEGVNIKDVSLSDFDRAIDLISVDVSFISLKKVIPKICELLSENGTAVMLVKPQFECGRADIGKNGIVRSENVHRAVLSDMISFCNSSGLFVMGADYSPIQGGDGNIEYLIYAEKNGGAAKPVDCAKITAAAHQSFKKA